MNFIKTTRLVAYAVWFAAFGFAGNLAHADDFVIDTKGMHSFVQFKVSHLGFSWLYGRFNKFDGKFSYDSENDASNNVSVTIDMTSLDSNHSERDKHLRARKYLNVKKHESASFTSTKYESLGGNKAKLSGKLTLLGVTKDITMDVDVLGGGRDPWGGYRQGFEGRTTINSADFGIKGAKLVGEVELTLSIEGVRK